MDPAEGVPEGREASTPRRPGVTRVGPYRLVRALGHGAFGDVYSAEDRILGRLVALKVLRAQLHPQFRRRIVQEARAAARLQHPFIAEAHRALSNRRRVGLLRAHGLQRARGKELSRTV